MTWVGRASLGVGVLCILLLVGLTIRGEWRANALGVALRVAEAAKLRAEGLVVERDASERALRAEADRLAKGNDELRDLLAEAERKLGEKPKVVRVIEYVTKPVVVAGDPLPVPPTTPCLLAQGSVGEIRVESVELQTRLGNRVAVGTAAAWRVQPGPATKLFSGGWEGALSTDAGVPAAAAPARSWAFGVWGGAGPQGWAVGPAVAAPALWRLEAQVGAGYGPGGLQAAASLVYRTAQ